MFPASGSRIWFLCGGSGGGVLVNDDFALRHAFRSSHGRGGFLLFRVPTSEERDRGSGGKGKAAPGGLASVSHWLVPSGQSSRATNTSPQVNEPLGLKGFLVKAESRALQLWAALSFPGTGELV